MWSVPGTGFAEYPVMSLIKVSAAALGVPKRRAATHVCAGPGLVLTDCLNTEHMFSGPGTM